MWHMFFQSSWDGFSSIVFLFYFRSNMLWIVITAWDGTNTAIYYREGHGRTMWIGKLSFLSFPYLQARSLNGQI